jgi:hypothetical protein
MTAAPVRCDGCGAQKRTWPTYSQAVHVVDFRLRRGARPLRVYPCPAALDGTAGWHITSQKRKEPKT